MISKVHTRLLDKSATYSDWHKNPYASPVHWAILSIAVILKLSLVISLLSPISAYAASTTWTTTSDFSGWNHSSNTEALSNTIRLKSTASTAATMTQTLPLATADSTAVYNASNTSARQRAFVFQAPRSFGGGKIFIYNPTNDTITTSVTTLPVTTLGADYYSIAIDPTAEKIYMFGHTNAAGTDASLPVYVYDIANDTLTNTNDYLPDGGFGKVAGYNTDNGLFYIVGQSFYGSSNMATYDPVTGNTQLLSGTFGNYVYARYGSLWQNNKMYIFGGYDGLSSTYQTNIYEYDPDTDQFTDVGDLPEARADFRVTYDPLREKAYLIGGRTTGNVTTDDILECTLGTSVSCSNSTVSLPANGYNISAAYDSQVTNRAFLFGGSGSGSNTRIAAYPGAYPTSASATKVLTPSVGTIYDWQSALVNATTGTGHTVTTEYTTNTNCSTGLTTSITSLANSESICIKVTLATTNAYTTPTLDDITITYTTPSSGGGSSSPSPSPSPSPTASATAEATSTPTESPTSTPTATPTPTVTTAESCTRNIRDVTVASNHNKATLTFTTPTATKGTIYYYTNSRTSPAGDNTKRATGYSKDSTKLEEPATTKTHSLELTDLQPLTTYYYTILSGASVQDCEHSFTTQETPPSPTPTPSVEPTITFEPTPEPTASITAIPEESVWSRIAGFIVGTEPLGPSGVGAIASAAVTSLALGTPTFELLVRLTTNIQNLPNQFNVFAWKRRRQTWGRVVSSLTLEGIPQAQVILYDLGNYRRVVDRYLTDKEGRFGFLVKPGTYGMSVARAGYSFPSTIRKDGYHSEEFKVGEDGVVQMDIPIDPAELHRPWRQKLEIMLVKLEVIRRPILALGTMFMLFNILSAITLLNIFFLAYYARLWYAEFHRTKESRHILTLKGENGAPIGFAIVRLKNKEGKVVLTKATDVNGRVFLLVERGHYTLEVTPPAGSTTQQGLTKDLYLPSGILAKPLIVDIAQPAFA